MAQDVIRALYRLETSLNPWRAAESLAGEQSAGTFVRTALESDELIGRHGAKVETVEVVETLGAPSLPGAAGEGVADEWTVSHITIAFPLENIGTSLAPLMTMLAGNAFELNAMSGLRLIDFEVPQTFSDAQLGPQFGIAGTRRLAGVSGGPLVGTIIKPSVGLTPEQTAGLAAELARADIDFIKDDELISNPPYSPVAERARAVLEALKPIEDARGRPVMVAFNITDDLPEMLHHHDSLATLGANCIMVNLTAVGITGLQELRRHSSLPIHAHRSGWGALTRHPSLGFDYRAWQKFFRFAGADHMHVNGLRNKFCEDDASVIASAVACQTAIHGRHQVMPVFSSGQTVWQVADTYRALGNADLMYLAGGGIMGHPMGPGAGMQALRRAWSAALEGQALEDAAKESEALRVSMETFKA